MSDALYPLLSGAVVMERRLEEVSNNLANANTPAFKRRRTAITEKPSNAQDSYSKQSAVSEQVSDWRNGASEATGRPLDVAVMGEGFLVFEGEEGLRFSRDGSLHVNLDGHLANRGGQALLSKGSPIFVGESSQVRIDGDGRVRVGEDVVGEILTTRVEPSTLRAAGSNAYVLDNSDGSIEWSRANLLPGSIEASNVNSVEEMVELISASRTYSEMQGAIQSIRDADRRLVQELRA